MNGHVSNEDSYQSLLLLEEISKEEPLSQRDLSKRLGIALGLVNSYVKNMVSKGYVRVSSFPQNRYKYLLTPKGIAEKSRLTYQHLHYFTNLYTTARKDFKELFKQLEKEGVKKVVFCGIDEVAEIAYLSLQEKNLELLGVVDTDFEYKAFFRHPIITIENVSQFDFDKVVITSLKKKESLFRKLSELGLPKEKISILRGH